MPLSARAASIAGIVVRAGAAAVWLVAGIAKLPGLVEFKELVDRYGILPPFLSAPFAYALPFVEVGIGLYLLAGLFVRGTAMLGTGLFALFLTAQLWALLKGIPLDCGCFGTAVSTQVGPLTILRDLGLGLPTFAMLALPSRALSLDRRLFGAEDRFAVVLGGAARRQEAGDSVSRV